MNPNFSSTHKIENKRNADYDNSMNWMSLNNNDLELEKSNAELKENDLDNEMGHDFIKNNIYHTMIINNKKIDIHQYDTFPKTHLNSVYKLLSSELSEPYNIFLLKTILKNYSKIALMSLYNEECVGVVISKITTKCKNNEASTFGYICMIAVDKSVRKCGLGSYLLNESIKLMQNLYGINEVQLEAEATNIPTLRFYEQNEFIKVKRKPNYYLSGSDAFKLKKVL
ncbi:acetyltransferase, putative [Plasmodium berghei]|uniref:N-acetyltransferase, GNAT family, putative n=2 Tax=Plasmodium berghei TaxID=5821 RepID=A0A509ANV4_PLABA|nr:N-acetyltransferase, GNAT family, putative [Plasmodium berghei ANKA]CXI78614.1 acetyltransferase, putative [Plasmodium berghei]SCM25201.1 acetyltransferase, putative [Plasmodium berghei]SCN27294.1 acetyltransferase, putative [Plasmodium berghei]SCO61909.1 acetyltransferase, putative [Plasmodium berghei]SCO63720.1 acetyltransferase, putative [Plasmodium berghei]|eukprot:XP_034422930.1 N-acetyltransferase, GNAT family, putative [Plasmodium berghei ANKA]